MKTKKFPGKQNMRRGSGSRRPAKTSIHVRGSWKAVDLDPSIFSEEGMGELVCFEELTDYRLVDSVKAGTVNTKKEKKKKANKRKATDLEQDGEQVEAIEGGDETKKVDISEKPAKKKIRKKNKIVENALSTPEDVPAGDQEDEGESIKSPVAITTKEKGEEACVTDSEQTETAVLSSDKKTTPPKDVTEKSDKKKKNKKNKQAQKDKQTRTEISEPETEKKTHQKTQQHSQHPRPTKLPKKKAKNWTAGGTTDQNCDVSAWKDLFVPDLVLKALSSLGFVSPTPIQALALPPAIRDRMDIVGAAETGSGKTLSFGIPMIHTILEWRKGPAVEEESEKGKEEAPSTGVESLYLPDEATGSAECVSIETGAEVVGCAGDEAPKGTLCEEAETCVGSTKETTEEEQEAEEEAQDDEELDKVDGEEEEDFLNDEGLSEEEIDNDDDDDGDGDDSESEDKRLGCVKVIEDVEFDFDTGPNAEKGLAASQKQPLLGLVLTPTRELAVQVKHHIDAVATFTGIKTAILVGGMAQQKQVRMLRRRPEIVIATPGRLWELIRDKHPHLQNLRQLRCLVIDEADRMVEKGHFAELENLLEMLNTEQFNPKRQVFVFSATLTMVPILPSRVLQKKKRNKVDHRSRLELLMAKVGIRSKPKVIDLTRKEATVESLTETRIHCEKDDKDFFLYYFLLQYPGRTMVFANSIDCIKRLNSLLVILERAPLPLHANMHQKQRLKNLERFAERESAVLLTTDVAARGLDIPNVQHVLHYQVPRTSETYVHRSGRTARAAKEGLSLMLIGPDDMMNFRKIYKTLGKDEEELPVFPIQGRCMAAVKERVNLARKIEKIEFHNSKEKQHNSWFKQAAEALEVDLDEDVLIGGRKDEEDERQQHMMVKGMKRHLKHMLSQPVFDNLMRTKYPTQMGKLALPEMPLAGVETALTSVSIEKKNQKRRKKQNQP